MLAVIYGGPSPEHDISVLTGLQAAYTLERSGYRVERLYWDKKGLFWQVDGQHEASGYAAGAPRGSRELEVALGPEGGFIAKRKRLALEAAVLACHGVPGESGELQSLLDLLGIAYTGPSVAVSALCMDKLLFGEVVRGLGIPTLPRVVGSPATVGTLPFDGPYVVKPIRGGSSIGVELVADRETVRQILESSRHLREGAVVEPALEGARDLNIGVRTWPQIQLSAIERPVREKEFYSYDEKYLTGAGLEGSRRELPAAVPEAVEKAIHEQAEALTRGIGLRGIARIDFLERDGEVWLNEVNTIPGSFGHYLFRAIGVDFATLLRDMVDEAIERGTSRFQAIGADGRALQSAATIASKLA